jgi:release factor glutamine methyltransferase
VTGQGVSIVSTQTVRDALALAVQAGLDRLDGQLLLLHALGRHPHDRAWLLTHDGDFLGPSQAEVFFALCERRKQGEPVAYILGQREFYGLTLRVDARVLDPRPDTETLVDWALEHLPADQPARVLDLGTGSGAIALAIASQRPVWHVVGVDLSEAALGVAQGNGQLLGIRVDWRQGHWCAPVATERFDLIVTNPPYIREDDPHLAALRHEPRMALTSGPSGLEDIATIVSQARPCLNRGAALLIEHGHDQAQAVRDLLVQHGFTNVQHRPDLAGIRRCTGGHAP